MAIPSSIVILGAGQAASQAVLTLRNKGYKGALTVVGDEAYLPYQRPPLSKKFLKGEMTRENLLIFPASYYPEHAVETRLGRRAVRIERQARKVVLDDGSELSYDALLIATGSRPRRLKLPGSDLKGVFYIRGIDDVDALRESIAPGKKLAVIGGGYIGLEAAACARELGLEVTVLEAADRVLKRVAAPAMSAFFEQEHRRHGVRVDCNAAITGLLAHPGSDQLRAIQCKDGSEIAADAVVIGVGAEPVDELAREAGLACDNGILVDAHCRTEDPHIFAAGDCTNHPNRRLGTRVRLESIDNANEQASCAALNMMGTEAVYDRVPWFWSNQYDLRLIIVGLNTGYDRAVTRGSPESRSFSICYLRGTELLAVETINCPKDQMAARKLLVSRPHVDLDKLADISIPLPQTCLPA